jgi:anti-sigma B factor antagonist
MSIASFDPITPLPPLAANRYEHVLDGPLDAEAILRLRAAVVAAERGGPTLVLVDASAVTKVTPSGVAGMLDLLRLTRAAGGDFRVYGQSRGLGNAHAALRLTSVVAVYRNRDEALASTR